MKVSEDLSDSTISKYLNVLKKINLDLSEKNTLGITLEEINSTNELEDIKKEYFLIQENRELDERGNRMYSSAFNKLISHKSFLSSKPFNNSRTRLIEYTKSINSGNIKRFINCRIGQKSFREKLLNKWNGRCPITGIDDSTILISSHIVPWSESKDEEKIDPENGILLSPLFDSLFDENLISFEDNGNIIFSHNISQENKDRFNLKDNIKIDITPGMIPYLRYHREKLKKSERK